MEEEREIEVRSLSGESVTVTIPSSKTLHEFKALLIECFSPASTSPNFHLFLRGVKLSPQSQIGNHSIGSGEFLVLVPFTKKSRSQSQQSDQSTSLPQFSHPSAASNLADLAWCDVMKDLSHLHNASDNESQIDYVQTGQNLNTGSSISNGMNGGDKSNMVDKTSSASYFHAEHSRGSDFKKKEVLSVELISSILQMSDKSVLDKEICEGFLKLLESVNCFSDVKHGNCLLLKKANLQHSSSSSLSCICPVWLKKAMKAFTFLNSLTAFLQVRQERVTMDSVKDALEKLGEFGLSLSVEDLKNLALLCPKVLSFVNYEVESTTTRSDNVLVIFPEAKGHQFENNPLTARKKIAIPKIICAMKKREILFWKNLQEIFKVYVCGKKCGDGKKEVSLEEVLALMKEADSLLHENGAKQRRRASRTSTAPSILKHCQDTHPISPMEMIEHLRKGIGSEGQIVHVEEIAARMAAFSECPDQLSEKTKSSLKSLGITSLYSHQAESIRASLAGKNVAVATLTSSGKSLCYNIPVLEALCQNITSCALYLFPTKALAQDQLRAFLAMTEKLNVNLNIGIYDGDTSQQNRIWLRDNSRLLITNPDMLHMSVLPCHIHFQRLLENLRFVVIDEAHSYKGAFGCHTAFILRRLRRLCSHVYGSCPQFVFCTATSANPREHAMELANLPTLELIQKDGSPSGPKLFMLWNPPLYPKTVLERSMGSKDSTERTIVLQRSSPIVETSRLLAEMVQHGLRCIAFCKSRKLCELVLSYTREILQDSAPHLKDSICAYRGGYIVEDRRRIEGEFFAGKLCGIAATNALELGIDVGHIDVTLHLGFPGSVASLWQQAGRSGRRGRPSLAVYVAFEGPLDQYFMRYPEKLFRSPIECCHADSQNQQVLEQHLACAAIEHPLSLIYDEKFFGPSLNAAIKALEDRGYLSSDLSREASARIWSYVGKEKVPSHAINIRAIESERYKVIDKQKNEVLEEIEESRAFFQVYEGAVYMNQGKNYLVKELDLSSRNAFCQEADLKYYTKTRDYTDIHVIGGDMAYSARDFSVRNTVFDSVELSLPKYSYESQAVWIRVPQSVKTAVERENFCFRAGLHAASHAVLNVVPIYIICNSSDLASECVNPHDTRYMPERILLYDQHPGGTGLSIKIQPLFTEILTAALELLLSCCCAGDTGCPNCVQSLACHEYNEVLHKEAAIMIIQGVLEAEKESFGGVHHSTGNV
ncbi:hypothetical protein Ancab_038777 [Ancistrocladus abbreviatus]